jgi:hypothetical protein
LFYSCAGPASGGLKPSALSGAARPLFDIVDQHVAFTAVRLHLCVTPVCPPHEYSSLGCSPVTAEGGTEDTQKADKSRFGTAQKPIKAYKSP